MPWSSKSLLYEINTTVWLHSLSQRCGEPITLANVPDEVLNDLASYHLDAVWLMGVWTRSPQGRKQARRYIEEYRSALPDIVPEDIVGSPYAVWEYSVDPAFGGPDALASLRQRLRDRGMGLVLDYVPNHVALDHDWVQWHPDYLIRGTERDLKQRPSDFFATKDAWGRRTIVAHGRDPYFPGWSDTAQVNAFSPGFRQATRDMLLEMASQCDGLRCDMAMLMVNRIFTWTWEGHHDDTPVPMTEFWEVIIPAVKAVYPDFLFMAEVYWNMEYEMQRQGFDMTYDKQLYDRLVDGSPGDVSVHLIADPAYQRRMIRFIENHDEARAYTSLGPDKERPAATLAATLPGMFLMHEGQFTGARAKLPVQITRQPDEPEDADLLVFYRDLLAQLHAPIYQTGDWRLFNLFPAWSKNESHNNLVAHGWSENGTYRLIVVNLSAVKSQGTVNLSPWAGLGGHEWRLYDLLGSGEYSWHGDQLLRPGLFVELDAYQSHILQFERL
jgi:hypothetical protein